MDRETSLSTLWSVARNLRNYNSSPSTILDYSEQWMDDFSSKICPDFVPPSIDYKTNSINYFPELCNPFSIAEFDMALSITKNTAPGIDNIKFIVLNN